MTNEPSNLGSKRWIVPAGLLFGAVVAAIFVAGYAWQNSRSDSKLTEAVAHAETAVFLQEASAEGTLAADLLGEYVATGDEALIPRIQNHSTTALSSITGAISGGGSDELRQIAVAGTGLAEGAGSVIALRQAGDVEGASAVLTSLSTEFEAFGLAMQAAIDTEIEAAVSLTNSSENADDTASWLLITGIAAAISTGIAFVLVIGRSLTKPRAPESASPA